MSEIRPADLPLPPDAFDGSRSSPTLSPADAAVLGGLAHPPLSGPPGDGGTPPMTGAVPGPPVAPQTPPGDPPSGGRPKGKGAVMLNRSTLCRLREAKFMSQEELVNDFDRRNIRVSIATIKRAETGHAVRYRIVRELARYFGVSLDDLLH
jgi:hypothetical protein